VLKSLEALSKGTPAEILLEAAIALNLASIKEIVARSRLESSLAESALQELLLTNSLVALEEGKPEITSDLLVAPLAHWNALREKTVQTVGSYHKNFPLRRGIPREELKSRLKLAPRPFNALISALVARQLLVEQGSVLAMPGHEIRLESGQQLKVQALNRKFEQNPFSPPSVKEAQAEVGEDVLNALLETDSFVLLSSDVIFRKPDYDLALRKINELLLQRERITLAEVRDLLDTSRKYAQALLEHLDSIGVTMRDGDYRKLKKKV
jgi:selenocysteine-specific elongation factor